MKKMLILLFYALMVFPALAEKDAPCDAVPPELMAIVGENAQDCLLLKSPDGSTHAVIITEGGELYSYRMTAGEWTDCVRSGSALEGYDDVYLRPAADGYTVYSLSGPEETYAWDGEAYYTLFSWRDPAHYDGTAYVRDTVISYVPTGSDIPEYEVDTEDEEILYGWIWSFERRPATPEEAKARASILPNAVRNELDGYTLAAYESNAYGTKADAVFARIKDGCLQIVKARFTPEKGRENACALLDIPLSDSLMQTAPELLWQQLSVCFRGKAADVLDSARLPVSGTICNFHPQREQLVLLTEDATNSRRVVIVTQDDQGHYHQAVTGVLPPDSGLDTFHAGENEIQLQFENQGWCVGYRKSASGAWTLRWVMGEDMDYSVEWGRVRAEGYENGEYKEETRIIGMPDEGMDLLTARFDAIPHTWTQLLAGVDSDGWAAVNNPNPADRLNLRTKGKQSADSYGKYYNGTPVRVLKTLSDWCQVRIGENGLTGWMMKKYLAFGEAADSVAPAFPALLLREERIGKPQTVWTDRGCREAVSVQLDGDWTVIGVADDLYILLSGAGDIVYAPMDWFWEGNG